MKKQIGETELQELEEYCSNITKVGLEPVTLLISEVRERRAHEDRYRWHIRPEGGWTEETVPDTGRLVEVRTDDSMPYCFGWYDPESSFGMWYDAAGFPMDPYKWRDIEEEVSE